MVGSDNKAQETNREYGSYYSHIPEGFFFVRVIGYYMRDDAEAWEDKNIDFRVAKESEQMLIENWVSASGRVKEGSI